MRAPRTAPSWVALVAAFAVVGPAPAQQGVSALNGYVTLSNGYWKHGLAHTDGASLQLGIDYQHYSGFFTYARVMNVDYPQNLPYQDRDVEAGAYVGFHERHERWSWTVSAGRYWYPGADGYDYGEWSASVGYRDRLFYTASYADEYYVRQHSALNQEIALAFPLPKNFEVGGAVGYFDIEDGPGIGHWNVGASKLVGRMAIDLRYYDGSYRWRSFLGDPDGQHLVLSLSYALKRN